MIECHTINKNDPVNNQIHGISDRNKKASDYFNSALRYLGNKIENTLLNYMMLN